MVKNKTVSLPVVARHFRHILDHLKRLTDGREIDITLVWLSGANAYSRPEIETWLDQVRQHPDHGGIVECSPWMNQHKEISSTALGVSVQVLRDFVQSVFHNLDVPEFFPGVPDDFESLNSAMEGFIAANEKAVRQGWGRVVPQINRPEWLRVIALAELELSRLTTEKASADPDRDGKKAEANGPRTSINTRMTATLLNRPDSSEWSVSQWADHLDCSRSAVGEAPAWKRLMQMRAEEKLKRASGRQNRTK